MKFATTAIHAGFRGDPTTHSAAVPIYQTSSYTFDDTKHGADLFNLEVAGNIYTRLMNPTNAILETRIAALENGIGALAVSSGMAAITYAIQALTTLNSNIVATGQLYGGTYNLFAHTLPKQGVTCRMVAHDDYRALRNSIDDETKALYCESIGNPAGNVVDIAKWAQIANEYALPLIVDNTVATPYLCRPFEHGAHIVVHSLTKYIGGHGTTLGGAIVDSGKFDWQNNAQRFAVFNEPDNSYHGVIYTQLFGAAAYIGRCRVSLLRNTGAALSPFNAFLIMQGLETLELRMQRHCENATKVANFLQAHPKVARVNYAALADSPYKATADKICDGKASGIVSFELKDGIDAGSKFIDALQLIYRLVNIGDAKTLACHPASTTHRQLNADELAAAGVSAGLVRLAVGIENYEDIIGDIEQALCKI